MLIKNSGLTAIRNGKNLEAYIEYLIKKDGYTEVDKKRFDCFSKVSEQPIYSKQADVGKTIYDTTRNCDFIIFHPKKFKKNLIIECKWQQSSGSVDEKYPFLIQNIKLLNIDTIIILDGKGYRVEAETWVKKQMSGCLKNVVNVQEFLVMVNNKYLQ